MRRLVLPLVLLMGCLAPVPSAVAQIAFGLHVGLDFIDTDALPLADLELSDGSWVSLEREAVEAPLVGGLHLCIGTLPGLDLELGIEGSLREYAVSYEHRDSEGGDPRPGEHFSEEVRFGRLSAYASGKFRLVDLPLLKVYAGGGGGYHLLTPLLGSRLLETRIVADGKSGAALAPDELLSREGVFGAHVLAGVRFRPSFLPVDLSAEGRFLALPQNDYGDDTHHFFSMLFGLGLGF